MSVAIYTNPATHIFTHKYCPDCKAKRPISEFGKNASRYDGLTSYCHKHQMERDRDRREKNRDKHRAYMRDYHAKRKAKMDKNKQAGSFAPIPPPATAPKCRFPGCGKALHHYDVARGECFRHPVARVRAAREGA